MRTLPFLLLVADTSSFGLRITHFAKIQPHGSSTERVRLRLPSVLLEGGPEAADKCIEAAPCLTQRTRAGCRRVWVAKEGTELVVNLGLPELVEVSEEF